tara:strand:+ start:2773 stop:3264 length:492 start_codon:yes stop_codon:yes gene_type:complete
MKDLEQYLLATEGNGAEQEQASLELIKSWLAQTTGLTVPASFLLSAENSFALLYVLERLHAVARGEDFLAVNRGQPKRAYRDHEIHKDIERQRSTGESLDLSIRQTTANLAEGLSGMDREVLSERSIRNIHGKSSSKTDSEWEDYILRRFAELGQDVIDDRDK